MIQSTEGRGVHREVLLYAVLSLLVLEGRNEFIVTKDFLEDEVWKTLKFTNIYDPNTQRNIIKLSLLGQSPIVLDAEFTIEQEQSALPPATKMLSP